MSAKELAYKLIKQRIIGCDYMPGDVLSENEIKNEINVGRTPIREALNKLENERLVKIFPKRGIFVTNVTVHDVSSIYSIREVMEPYAVGIAAGNVSKAQLIPFYEYYNCAQHAIEPTNSHEMDMGFHCLIYERTENQYLIDILKRIYDQNIRIGILSTLKVNNRRRNTCAEHLDIIQALLDGDVAKAKTKMKKHVVSGWKVALTITD